MWKATALGIAALLAVSISQAHAEDGSLRYRLMVERIALDNSNPNGLNPQWANPSQLPEQRARE